MNQASPDHFFKGVDKIASSKEPESVPSTSGVGEFVACPLSPIADDASAIPHHVSLVWSVTLLSCSLRASPCMPATVLYYCTFRGSLRLKIVSLFLVSVFL